MFAAWLHLFFFLPIAIANSQEIYKKHSLSLSLLKIVTKQTHCLCIWIFLCYKVNENITNLKKNAEVISLRFLLCSFF